MEGIDFELLNVLGEGATAVTYEAKDRQGRLVCVKRFKTAFKPNDCLKIVREIEILKSLNHPNIPKFYGTYLQHIDHRDILHLVMEKIEGENLQHWRMAYRPTLSEVINIILALLDIVIYLHEVRPPVIHRDIKTSNLMRDRNGSIVLIDFGQSIDAVDKTYGHTMVTGTLGYQAPEQISGEPTVTSDIYSIGVVTVELLTGLSPYTLLEGRKFCWTERCAKLPEALFQWLQDVLQTDPILRYSAREARGRLQDIQVQLISTFQPSAAQSHLDALQHRICSAISEEDLERERKERERYQILNDKERRREQKRVWDAQDEQLFSEMVQAWDRTHQLIRERKLSLEKGLDVFRSHFQGREAQRSWGESLPNLNLLFRVAEQRKEEQAYHEWLIFRSWDDEDSLFSLRKQRRTLQDNIRKLEKEQKEASWFSGLFQAKTTADQLAEQNEFQIRIQKRIDRLEERVQHCIDIFSTHRSAEEAVEQVASSAQNATDEMILIARGMFWMGAPDSDNTARSDEKPQHQVRLTRDFYLGMYPVTQTLWEDVMGYNPSWFDGAVRPVEQVSWLDCVQFCNKLSEREGRQKVYTIQGRSVTCDWTAKGYRLPTEAEWSFAAKGHEEDIYSGGNNPDEVAWWQDNSQGETRPVGLKKANKRGIFDLSGNVWEWCWDGKDGYPNTRRTDPATEENKMLRVLRGGCWDSDSSRLRLSARAEKGFREASFCVGFRLARFA